MDKLIDFLVTFVVLFVLVGTFMYFLFGAWDREYEIEQERIEQYKMEMAK